VVQSACVAPVVALTAVNIGTTTPAPSGARFGAAGLAQRAAPGLQSAQLLQDANALQHRQVGRAAEVDA
jgi:hypothetical protein